MAAGYPPHGSSRPYRAWALRNAVRAMQLSNYLFFTTCCEPALEFYAHCGLGQIVEVARFGDNGMPVADGAMRGKIMHAKFEGPGVLFYASDNDDAEPMRGSAHILWMDDREQTLACSTACPKGAGSRRPSVFSHGATILGSSLTSLGYSGC
jgi:PhnB protein